MSDEWDMWNGRDFSLASEIVIVIRERIRFRQLEVEERRKRLSRKPRLLDLKLPTDNLPYFQREALRSIKRAPPKNFIEIQDYYKDSVSFRMVQDWKLNLRNVVSLKDEDDVAVHWTSGYLGIPLHHRDVAEAKYTLKINLEGVLVSVHGPEIHIERYKICKGISIPCYEPYEDFLEFISKDGNTDCTEYIKNVHFPGNQTDNFASLDLQIKIKGEVGKNRSLEISEIRAIATLP